MEYAPSTETKQYLASLDGDIDWLNEENNFMLWDHYFDGCRFDIAKLKQDLQFLVVHTPRDMAMFINAYSQGVNNKIKPEESHRWYMQYEKWVDNKYT